MRAISALALFGPDFIAASYQVFESKYVSFNGIFQTRRKASPMFLFGAPPY